MLAPPDANQYRFTHGELRRVRAGDRAKLVHRRSEPPGPHGSAPRPGRPRMGGRPPGPDRRTLWWADRGARRDDLQEAAAPRALRWLGEGGLPHRPPPGKVLRRSG